MVINVKVIGKCNVSRRIVRTSHLRSRHCWCITPDDVDKLVEKLKYEKSSSIGN